MLVVPIVAFGRWHIECAQYLLASLKSAGNLPDVESRVQVYTNDAMAFRGYEVIPINPRLKATGKHQVTMDCYRAALKLGHPIIPVSADMICPTGMLRALEQLANSGIRLAVCPVLRSDAGLIREVINFRTMPGGVLSLSPRELMRLAMARIHHRQLGMYWPRIGPTNAPTSIFRRSRNTIVARCFHMHPLMVVAKAETIVLEKSFDAKFVDTVPRDEIHIITDSDETAVIDQTDKNYRWEQIHSPIGSLIKWIERGTNKTHRWFFEHECYLHSEDIERLPPDAALEKLRAEVMALPATH